MRYTALLGGVFYGIVHRRTLQKAHDAEVKHHAIHEREHLIEEAKEAWKKKQEAPKGGCEYSHQLLHSSPTAMPISSLHFCFFFRLLPLRSAGVIVDIQPN